MNVLIAQETERYRGAIREVTAAAFATDDGSLAMEAWLIDALRGTDAWIPQLSLVAIEASEVVGHVLCTRAHVGQTPVLALGPLSVRPSAQRSGIGTALVRTILSRIETRGEPLIAVLGDPAYYSRFGFRPAAEYGIEPPLPQWAPHFQVLTLPAYDPSVRGAFAYPRPFMEL
jgi:putative acetyltransferase